MRCILRSMSDADNRAASIADGTVWYATMGARVLAAADIAALRVPMPDLATIPSEWLEWIANLIAENLTAARASATRRPGGAE